METGGLRHKLTKATQVLLILFALSLLLALAVVATHPYPIYVRGLEFHIDIPDEEFSTDDFGSAIEVLETHEFIAQINDQIPWYCNRSLRISPADNPRLKAYLGTECNSSVWGHVFIFGWLEYPAYHPSEVGYRDWLPLVDEEMGQVMLLLEMTPTSQDIMYDDDDFGISEAILQFLALPVVFGMPIALGTASAFGVIRRRQLKHEEASIRQSDEDKRP